MSWGKTIDIKKHLNTGKSTLEVAEAIKEDLENEFGFNDTVNRLVVETKKATDAGLGLRQIEAVFNSILDEIYDLANEYRIWLGF